MSLSVSGYEKCNDKKRYLPKIQFQDMKKCNEKKGNSLWFQFQKLYLKSNWKLIKFTPLSVSGCEEVQWKETKFTMGSVSGYQEEHWKERKFTMDSVSEVVSEIRLKINKIHATFSFGKWKNAIKRKKIRGGFSAWGK